MIKCQTCERGYMRAAPVGRTYHSEPLAGKRIIVWCESCGYKCIIKMADVNKGHHRRGRFPIISTAEFLKKFEWTGRVL